MTRLTQYQGTIRIGTRGSRLARWQADWVAEQLRGLVPELNVELVEIKTHGDRDRKSPLATIGGVGLFTKEIQRAVRDGLVDVAVHSLKDLPTQGPGELVLAAVPAREDVADALIAPEYQTIKGLTRRCTSRHRLTEASGPVTVLASGPEGVALRGNVETRLEQVLEGSLMQ